VSDTVTLALEGAVSLSEFSAAVGHFNRLVVALTAEAKAEDVTWQIDALDYSSAITTARGVSENGAHPERIDQVVRSYLEVGEALEKRATIPYAPSVKNEAEGIVGVLSGPKVEAIRFETAEAEAIVREAPLRVEEPAVAKRAAYGAVTGRIQTLTSRNALRFLIYDHIHDRAVSCYLEEGREWESIMRQMWDREATVEGWVTRDPKIGRPTSVRRITRVTPLQEVDSQDYMRARAALPLDPEEPKPEETIRRLRDAG